MIPIILASLAVIVVLFVIIVALQPTDFRVARSISISVPPSTAFEQVNDIHKFQDWSPFAKMDPNARNIFAGPPAGKGASLTWAGNNKAGEGTMTVIESQPGDLVRFKLEFRKPFTATNLAKFTFEPEDEQTLVTWSMSGKNNFMFKAFRLFMNCDKMVGREFEKGLASLKSLCESPKELAVAH